MKNMLILPLRCRFAHVPRAASAQAVPAAVIAVVDLEKVTADCNACKTAAAALRSQVTALAEPPEGAGDAARDRGRSRSRRRSMR